MATGTRPPIDLAPISNLLDLIMREWAPLQIWLFGSRVRAEATAQSDWDLLVVVSDGATGVEDPVAGWRLRKASGVRSDVLLVRAGDFAEDRGTPNTLAYEASHGGVLIYER